MLLPCARQPFATLTKRAHCRQKFLHLQNDSAGVLAKFRQSSPRAAVRRPSFAPYRHGGGALRFLPDRRAASADLRRIPSETGRRGLIDDARLFTQNARRNTARRGYLNSNKLILSNKKKRRRAPRRRVRAASGEWKKFGKQTARARCLFSF